MWKNAQKVEDLDLFWLNNVEQLPEDRQLKLLDNVQFIYELALAQLELQSFGVKFAVTGRKKREQSVCSNFLANLYSGEVADTSKTRI